MKEDEYGPICEHCEKEVATMFECNPYTLAIVGKETVKTWWCTPCYWDAQAAI